MRTGAQETLNTGKHTISLIWTPAVGDPRGALILAHGAGANMNHPSMEGLAGVLSSRGLHVLRFNFPYTEEGRKRPDSPATLIRTWLDVWEWSARHPRTRALPVLAGGRSMGGRMASMIAADHPEEFTPAGLVFFAYPLHPRGRTDRPRVEHLRRIMIPMLFLSGTRDSMAVVDLMDREIQGLGMSVRLIWLDGADHGFHVLKRSGRTDDDIIGESADRLQEWFDGVLKTQGQPGG